MHLWKGDDYVIVDANSEAEKIWRAKGYAEKKAAVKAPAASVAASPAEPAVDAAEPQPAGVEPIAPTATELAPKPVPMRRVGKRSSGSTADED